jgi:hypothetical protein
MWECNCTTWYELTSTTGQLPTAPSCVDWHHPRITPWEYGKIGSMTLIQYEAMVNHYNSRKLSHPEDGMSAFMGVTNRLSDVFPGGFLWGLPSKFFNAGLLWQPVDEVTRRCPENRCLPSWSWVGWEGDIQFTHKPDIIEFQCTWRYEEIDTTWGHTCHRTLSYGYAPQQPNNLTSKLYTRTEVAMFFLRSKLGELSPSDIYNITRSSCWITKSSEGWRKRCGIMKISPECLGIDPGATYKLMAIGRGITTNILEWANIEVGAAFASTDPFVESRDKVVYVLCIETKDGLASRKGVGVVWESAWLDAKPQSMDITLV